MRVKDFKVHAVLLRGEEGGGGGGCELPRNVLIRFRAKAPGVLSYTALRL